MSTTDDEVEQLLRRTRAGRERCNNRMALIGKNDFNLLLIIKRWGFPIFPQVLNSIIVIENF